ncbi:hypothetical protein AB4Y45_34910 [Paraburkholderia sp. EG287A]|uniref:hypothetical protein n=1 Tax=Paraburkholderia sp. EG287A TaxID=3237012 RepID=UPI0034D24A96
MFVTDQHSLEFWIRLRGRLATAFDEGRARLAEYRNKVLPATVNDAVLMRSRAASARTDALTLLTDLANLRLLMLSLDGQLAYASHSVNLPFLESQILCLRDAIDIYRSSVCGLPQRQTGEDDLTDYVRQYEALRNAGNGDFTANERLRLRDQCVSLRVLGREDGAAYEDQCRNFETDLDHLATSVQHLKATTLVAIDVPDNSVKALEGFGVRVVAKTPLGLPDASAGTADAVTPAGEELVPVAPPAVGDAVPADVQA